MWKPTKQKKKNAIVNEKKSIYVEFVNSLLEWNANEIWKSKKKRCINFYKIWLEMIPKSVACETLDTQCT